MKPEIRKFYTLHTDTYMGTGESTQIMDDGQYKFVLPNQQLGLFRKEDILAEHKSCKLATYDVELEAWRTFDLS
jgi:hypothetical protein